MGIVEHAKYELKILEDSCKDKDSLEMQKKIDEQVIEVIKVLANQGHSGFTAPYIMGLIIDLWNWKSITPLTGEEDEWNDVADEFYQNKRCSAVFKDKDTGKAYYIDGYAYCEPFDNDWFTTRESKKCITFPCDSSQLETEYRKLIFPRKIVPIKIANKLHLYRKGV